MGRGLGRTAVVLAAVAACASDGASAWRDEGAAKQVGQVSIEAQEVVREKIVRDSEGRLEAKLREIRVAREKLRAVAGRAGAESVAARLALAAHDADEAKVVAIHAAHEKAVRSHPVVTEEAIGSGAFYGEEKAARERFEKAVAAAHRVALDKVKAAIAREEAESFEDEVAARAIERAWARVARVEARVRILEAQGANADGAVRVERRRALGQLLPRTSGATVTSVAQPSSRP
ncbi:MAG: hypothetical protein HYY84_02210 [Deltaproteobacteria bacterium]|nr:hypothetical protein [Deltaproteobacteria bacterium]